MECHFVLRYKRLCSRTWVSETRRIGLQPTTGLLIIQLSLSSSTVLELGMTITIVDHLVFGLAVYEIYDFQRGRRIINPPCATFDAYLAMRLSVTKP